MDKETRRQLTHICLIAFAFLLRYLDRTGAAACALLALVFNLTLLPCLVPALFRQAEGKLSDEQGASALAFLLRITVFENSNQVLLDCTVENAGGTPADLSEVTAGVTRRATENMTYDFRFGTSAGEVTGAVPKGSESKTISLTVSDARTFSVAGPAAVGRELLCRGARPRFPAEGAASPR